MRCAARSVKCARSACKPSTLHVEIERRVSEQRDDLELMIKAELGGGLAHMQTQLEHHLRPIENRLMGLDRLEARVTALENRT